MNGSKDLSRRVAWRSDEDDWKDKSEGDDEGEDWVGK